MTSRYDQRSCMLHVHDNWMERRKEVVTSPKRKLFLFYWNIVEYTLLYVFWSQERIQRVMDIVKFIFLLCSTYSKKFYDVRNLNYLKLSTYGWQRTNEKRFEDIRILQRMRINHRQCWRPNINKCFWKTAQSNPVPPWYKHSSYLERGKSVACSE
jgi:hypothetical protein